MRLISSQIDGVAERLTDSGLLSSESLIHYINGYTICTVDVFKRVFSNKAVEYTYLDATGESSFSSMTNGYVLKEMHEISTATRAIFDHLHLGNKWNLPGKHGHHAAATVTKCDNCGSAMTKSARRLAKHEPRLKKLREVVDEAVVDVEVEQVVEIVMGNVLLGMLIPQRAPTLESQTLMVLGKCIVPNAVGGMKHTLPSIMKSSNDLQLRSRCHHTILSG